jgi:hypothetical protein
LAASSNLARGTIFFRGEFLLFGVILGRAFDRALWIVFARWPYFLLGWALTAAADLVEGTGLSLLAFVVFSPVIGYAVGKSLRSDYSLRARNVFRYWGVVVLFVIAFGVLPFAAADILIPSSAFIATIESDGVAGFGMFLFVGIALLAYVGWLGTQLSFAPAIAFFNGLTVEKSIASSWRLVSGRFWHILVFNAVLLCAQLVAAIVPGAMIKFLISLIHPGIYEEDPYVVASYLNAALEPGSLYCMAAAWTAYLLCLDWLQSASAPTAARATS